MFSWVLVLQHHLFPCNLALHPRILVGVLKFYFILVYSGWIDLCLGLEDLGKIRVMEYGIGS